jgi:hypothetical protein
MPVRPKDKPSSLLLSSRKAADYIGIGRTKLLALGAAGKIKAKLQDGKRYYVTASLHRYVESLPDA